jgi:hypothetical protein
MISGSLGQVQVDDARSAAAGFGWVASVISTAFTPPSLTAWNSDVSSVARSSSVVNALAPDPYIRFRDPDDLGLRPPDAPMYSTPAIWIQTPAGVGTGDPAIAYADIAQSVRVEVGNRGSDVANATVTVWAFGFGTLSGYSASLGGVNGTSRPLVIPANTSGPAASVSVPWTPQAAELGGPERHFCIRANVFVDPNDQLPNPAGTAPVLDPLGNIRHAQRNMTLLPKPVNAKAPMEFDLAIANPDEEEDGEFTFEVQEIRGKLQRNEIAHLRKTLWIDPKITKGLALPGTGGEVEVKAARRRAEEFGLELGRKGGKKLKTRLKPGEQGTMRLQMAIRPGDEAAVHRFDVFQHGREGLVGAARVMTIAVPEELLERSYQSKTG